MFQRLSGRTGMGLRLLVIFEAMPLAVCTFLVNEVVSFRLLEYEPGGLLPRRSDLRVSPL